QELIGLRPPMPYWHPEHIERLQEIHDMILSGQGPRAGVEVKLRRKNGDALDALIFEAPLIDASGRQTGWMGSIMDITERKRARELARQQDERLQEIGRASCRERRQTRAISVQTVPTSHHASHR